MNKVAILAALVAGASITVAAAHEGKGGRMLERLKAADTNADGLISRAEAAALPRLAERFDAIDANKDGQLSADELKAARGRHGGGMRGADADHDGRVSQQEFLARAAARFQRLDTNGDGFISQEEMAAGHHGHRGR